MLRFLHGSDFHLDAPFHALPPAEAASARRAQYELLERFSALAIKERVDLVFLSGNLFDDRRVCAETLEALQSMLAQLPCPVFIAPGNSDYYHDNSPYRWLSLPERIHIFKSETVEAVELPALRCTVYGAAFTDQTRTSPPLKTLQLGESGLHIGVFRGEITTEPRTRRGPIHPDAAMGSGLHYLALGHEMSASGLLKAADTYYAYPGAPQGRSFDEPGERGVYLGEMDRMGAVKLQFRPLCLWQYQILSVDVTDKAPEAALFSALPGEKCRDIARVILEGTAPDEGLSLPALASMAQRQFYSAELIDQTLPGKRTMSRQTEESLQGLFLREMAGRMDSAPPEEREERLLALKFGLTALAGREAAE